MQPDRQLRGEGRRVGVGAEREKEGWEEIGREKGSKGKKARKMKYKKKVQVKMETELRLNTCFCDLKDVIDFE